LLQAGKIALLSSRHSKGNDSAFADKQLNDFKEQWAEWKVSRSPKFFSINLDVDDDGVITRRASSELSAALQAPDVPFIFAFDTPSLEIALSISAANPRTTPIPIIAAFNPTAAILKEAGDGRIYACACEDPYCYGYEGVVWAAKLCRCDMATRPVSGHGSVFIPGQIVQEANLDVSRLGGRWL
jgi:ABC-type sugar transport system substrate-binding protein